MNSREEKKQKLTEVAAALTDGNNIFSSGTRITAIVKAYGSVALSAEEKEVVGALALKIMKECIWHKIYREAELVIVTLHQQRFSFFNSLAVMNGESYSEQQLAIMALRVLHYMANHKLFISILEDTCWSGNMDDVRTRLELLSEVLEQLFDSEPSQIILWCSGRVLASLVTYYHQDLRILPNYHFFIDLPSLLEAAWNRGEACGDVEVMEQFTVTLSTAQRLGLPFSQHFLCRLRQKGVIVDNVDTLVPTENLHRPLQPQMNQRGPVSQWEVNVSRLPRGIERNMRRKRGAFRGFSRNACKRGKWCGQIAFRGK
ncbi:uncharacterized protein LOC126987942 isoform X2 [Eriocheir sinensis]|nr:uncharacterized protein LOC126987942 isoform X2 [Eriocheir sinensis]